MRPKGQRALDGDLARGDGYAINARRGGSLGGGRSRELLLQLCHLLPQHGQLLLRGRRLSQLRVHELRLEPHSIDGERRGAGAARL